MKSQIGLLVFGLLTIRYGSADVSHLQHKGHSQYLPPVKQNLPFGQVNNGLNSQHQSNGYLPPLNENRGYLPPEQDQFQNSHHQPQRGNNPHHHNDHDHNVQVSYNNDYAIDRPRGHVKDNSQESHGHRPQHDHHDDGHVDIDQEQLKPIHPSSLPNQEYLPPTVESHVSNPTVPTSHDEGHNIRQYGANQDHEGYHYPRPAQSTESLYPREQHSFNSRHSPQKPQQDYLPPNPSPPTSNGHGQREPNRGYLPPNRDYLPPKLEDEREINSVTNNGFSSLATSNERGHQDPHQGYLPPNRDYLPPNREAERGGVSGHAHQEPQQLSHHVHSNPVTNNGYLPPVQSSNEEYYQHSVHLQTEPQRDQLPPNSITYGSRPNQDSFVHDQSTRAEDLFLKSYPPPLNIVNNPSFPDPISIISPTQFGLVERQQASGLTVNGHVNVPLPIPQVGYYFIPGVVSRLPSLVHSNHVRLRPAINIPAIVSTPEPVVQLTQRIPTPPYTNTLLLSKNPQQSTNIQITPSIETAHFVQTYHTSTPQRTQLIQPHQNYHQTLQNGIQHLNSFQTTIHSQAHQQQIPVNVNHKYHHGHNGKQEFLQPNIIPNRGLSLQNIARSEVSDLKHGQRQNQNRHEHHAGPSANNKYLPPTLPSERNGSPQVHHKPASEQSISSIKSSTTAITLSKPKALKTYAPAMPYLPPAVSPSHQPHHSRSNADSPLEQVFDSEPNGLLDQKHGHIRTIQIINDHSQAVKNIQVLETADHNGVKTIKFLGPANNEPLGEHKVLRILSKGFHQIGHGQTVKIFADHKKVTLPSRNAYLPPPRS